MKFYFCDGCNKRITETDIASGLGKDKQLKGMYCADCASGVNTIEFQPLSELASAPPPNFSAPPVEPATAPHRRIAGKTPPHARTTSTTTLRAVTDSKTKRLRPHGSSRAVEVEAPAPVKPDSKTMLIAACSGGVVLLGLVLAYALSSGPAKPKDSETDKREVVRAAPPVIPKTAAPVINPAPIETQNRKEKLAVDAPVIPPSTDDDLASKAFDQAIKKINTLGADQLVERIAVAESFVNQFPNAMEASRMRVKITDWRKAAEPAAAQAASPAEAPAKTDAAAAPSGDTKILFSCNPSTPDDVGYFKDCDREQMDVFGIKGMAVKANAVPDPPWHSTIMNVSLAGKNPPVKISGDSWIRFACRVENTGHIMVHLFAGDGFYEAHIFGLPKEKWFWATLKFTDFQRDFRSENRVPKPGSDVHGIVLYSGENKIPSSLYVGEFTIGEGPFPKD